MKKLLLILVVIIFLVSCSPPLPDDEIKVLSGKNKEEWRQELTEKEYKIMFEGGTEVPFAGDLLHNERKGIYISAGCGVPVFSSETKYDSGTGWPSFYDVIEENVILREDNSYGWNRIEVLSKCGEHLGHVFDDGPKPTGKRYCINSAALNFIEEQ